MKRYAICVASTAASLALGAVTIGTDTTYGLAEINAISEGIAVSDGATLTLNLGSGETATISQVISGAGAVAMTGAGDLTLSGANTFAGGFAMNGAGKVHGASADAYGRSPISLAAAGGYLCFGANNATYTNDVNVSAKGFVCFDAATVTMKGRISATSDFYLADAIAGTRNFYGEIYAPGCRVAKAFQLTGNYYFRGRITAAEFRSSAYQGDDSGISWGSGNFHFHAANDIGTFAPAGSSFYVQNADAVPPTAVFTDNITRRDANYHGVALYNLVSHDVEIAAFPCTTNSGYKAKNDSSGRVNSSTGPATLKISGGGSYMSHIQLLENVSLDWAPPDDDSTLYMSNRFHTTAGTMAVSRGKVVMGGSSSASNLTAVAVGKDASFTLDSDVPCALKSLSWLSVGTNGTFALAGGENALSDGSVSLSVSSGGKLALPDGTTLALRGVSRDGAPMPPGRYRSAECQWLDGSDVTVTAGFWPQWTKATFDAYSGAVIEIPAGSAMEIVTQSGSPFSVTNVIAGEGSVRITGDGEVTLSAANSFAGGIEMAGTGIVRGTDAHAFGSGAVSLSAARGSVSFEVGDATFENDISVSARGILRLRPPTAGATVCIAGDISATSDFYIGNDVAGTYNFTGRIDAPGCHVIKAFQTGGTAGALFNFHGPIVCGVFRSSVGSGVDAGIDWGNGTVSFYAENDIGIVSPATATFVCRNANAFPASVVLTDNYLRDNAYHGASTLNMNGGDLTVSSLPVQTSAGYSVAAGGYVGIIDSTIPATLVVSGATCLAGSLLRGAVSLEWAPPSSSSVLSITNRASTTRGRLVVSAGILEVVGTASFSNVTEIVVKRNARFRLNTSAPSALASAKKVTVEDGGVFEVLSGANPLSGGDAGLVLESGATVYLADTIDAKFSYVSVDGALQPDGSYTSGWVSGGGSATVSGRAAVWKSAVSGAWGDGAKWSTGAAPGASMAAIMSVGGGDYSVSVASAAGTVKSLSVAAGSVGQHVSLSVSSLLEMSASGALDVGSGAKATVSGSGMLSFAAGSSGTSPSPRLNVRDGGVLSVEGGDVVATDISGSVVVGSGGTLSATSGTFSVMCKNAGESFCVMSGGTVSLSGDAQLLYNAGGWGRDALAVRSGGTLDVSGNAIVGPLDGATDCRVFGDGTVTFRGRSQFGRLVEGGVNGSGTSFCEGFGSATGVVTFVDSARIYDWGSSFRIDRTGGSRVMRCELASDASHRLNYCTYVGAGDGRGELYISRGYVAQGGMGLYVPGLYEKSSASGAFRTEGELRVSGGCLCVNAQNTPGSFIMGLVVANRSFALLKNDGSFYDDELKGWLYLEESGAITNEANSTIVVGVGGPSVEGHFIQTGGTLVDNANLPYAPMVVGMGGAKGEWKVSGGTADVAGNVYVGGITTNELGKTPYTNQTGPRPYPGYAYPGAASGVLEVTGGSVGIGGNLVLSGDGAGTLKIGKDGRLAVSGSLDARTGSKLVVDLRGYAGGSRTLARFGGTVTAFAPENVTLLADPGSDLNVIIDSSRIRVASSKGMVIIAE